MLKVVAPKAICKTIRFSLQSIFGNERLDQFESTLIHNRSRALGVGVGGWGRYWVGFTKLLKLIFISLFDQETLTTKEPTL